jgi:hypothetical protein
MIRLAITAEAFEAIRAPLPIGSVVYETQRTAKGGYLIWIEQRAMDRVTAERRRGEDLRDAIIPAGRDEAMIRPHRIGARAPAISIGAH